MLYLDHTTKFPEHSEWAYLYAVADVYKNYSCKNDYNGDLFLPHSLKDKEVVEIISKKYNLKSIHRNTIATIRNNLSTYFGFKFKTYKKGKYYVGQNNSIEDDDLLMIILCIKDNCYIDSAYKDKLVNLLMSMSSNKASIEKLNNSISDVKGYDLKEKFLLLFEAIKRDSIITFDYPSQSSTLTRQPTKIRDNHLECSDKYAKMYELREFDIRKMRNISIVKRGK